MSLLFFENETRFKPQNNESEGPSPPQPTQSAVFDLASYTNKLNSSKPASTVPKTPSNLVKQPQTNTTKHLNSLDKDQLLSFINETEKTLFSARTEYDKQYDTFFALSKKYNLEKLNNLKLAFKNQTLKQQIYFETELAELSKDCANDYTESRKTKTFSSSKNAKNSSKLDREKSLMRLFNSDMKRLLGYMKESLQNSSDTLIEAYETCRVLKSIEQAEASMAKHNASMKHSTSSLLNDRLG